jgi:hypothetical protein
LDRYIITIWARRTVIIILSFAAFMWGVRQASLTYQIWYPNDKKNEVIKITPAIPDGAKTIVENFLIFWFSTKFTNAEDKKTEVSDFLTDRVKNQLDNNPDFVLISQHTKLFRVDSWDAEWVEVGKKAYIRYLVQLEDNRTFLVQLPVVKEGTWLIDGLPTLLSSPVASPQALTVPPTLTDTELQQINQTVDGFFDSWLSGRQDQNTKLQDIAPTNLLQEVRGSYKDVVVTPIQTDPLIVSAVVQIQSQGVLPFEYQLQIGKQNGQYYVQKIIGGK